MTHHHWPGHLLIFVLGFATTATWLMLQPAGQQLHAQSTGIKLTAIPRTRVAALGRVEPRSEEMSIAAAMTGRLATVAVEEGESIVIGQVLATLENADHFARLQTAQAALAAARAQLDRVLNGARQAERDQAKAEVGEAKAVVELAQLELARQQSLEQRRLGSRQDLDRARSEYQVATARLTRARLQHELLESPPRADERAAAAAEVAVAESRLNEMRAVFEKSFVRSPINGVVLRKLRHPGEQVSELGDTPIVVIGDTSVLRVRAEVDEADIALVRTNQTVDIRADAFPGRSFRGQVSRIGNRMGRKAVRNELPEEHVDTRVLEVLIDLETNAPLPVGLRVDVYFALDNNP
ncbi:HlyD family secretion protein [Thiospirillum jenense]|uniref:Efflux RND transporter periplasmic adaptor subunit n=1 Tax=Thiospirillum jenense TaxID=1653858 RepID=A0A839HBH6_9GAMM|nr:efflux RND transporter periplasmic adaptor subunit [Thiospirillum jenense]MBB1126365.1 efflux RND transporter periplasmic adaptor subunit [Thiospirillum jenense]